jgi:chorismate-pyruvate lyase
MSGNFGDIMSQTDTVVAGDFSPIERICLTANGNLQRILSAYFNQKVIVNIIENNPTLKADYLVFDRYVTLNCDEIICCHAKSTITLTSSYLISLVNDNDIGIGQLFRLYF